MKKNKKPALIGALALVVGAPASAALYRCGNVFQDRPCDPPVQQERQHSDPGTAGPLPTTLPAARRPASAAAVEAVAHPAQETASSPAHDEAPAGRPTATATATATTGAASAPLRKGPPSLACGNLREQHTAIEARLKAGGRPETVEMYRRQQRDVERNLEDGNCL